MMRTAYYEEAVIRDSEDPFMAEAMESRLRGPESSQSFLSAGSIEKDISHLGSASGLAGVIKVVLMLERGHASLKSDAQKPSNGTLMKEPEIKVPFNSEFWLQNLTPLTVDLKLIERRTSFNDLSGFCQQPWD